MKNLKGRIKEGIVTRLPFLGLVLSIFFASYFPAISRYSINTLFNSQKRGYFAFLVANLQLSSTSHAGGRSANDLGIRWFGVILFICYILAIVSRASIVFYEKRARGNLRKITTERFNVVGNEELVESLSERVVGNFVTFFSCFCELFVDLWAVVSINRTREIKSQVLSKAFFCSVVMLSAIPAVENIIKRKEESKEDTSFLFTIGKIQQQSVFAELGGLFTILYFFFFPKESEVINAILLGFNISSVLNKLRNFVSIVPQTVSTYKMGRGAENILLKNHVLTN